MATPIPTTLANVYRPTDHGATYGIFDAAGDAAQRETNSVAIDDILADIVAQTSNPPNGSVGGTILIEGTLSLARQILAPQINSKNSHFNIIGYGPGSSQVVCHSTTNAAIEWDWKDGLYEDRTGHLQITNMTFSGIGVLSKGPIAAVKGNLGGKSVLIDNVWAQCDSTGRGFDLHEMDGLRMANCYAFRCEDGFRLENCQQVELLGCASRQNRNIGFNFVGQPAGTTGGDEAPNSSIRAWLYAESNADFGIDFRDVKNSQFHFWLENNRRGRNLEYQDRVLTQGRFRNCTDNVIEGHFDDRFGDLFLDEISLVRNDWRNLARQHTKDPNFDYTVVSSTSDMTISMTVIPAAYRPTITGVSSGFTVAWPADAFPNMTGLPGTSIWIRPFGDVNSYTTLATTEDQVLEHEFTFSMTSDGAAYYLDKEFNFTDDNLAFLSRIHWQGSSDIEQDKIRCVHTDELLIRTRMKIPSARNTTPHIQFQFNPSLDATTHPPITYTFTNMRVRVFDKIVAGIPDI